MTERFRLTERDLDLILLEELHAGTAFDAWLADRIGIEAATFVSAEHSVSAKANAKWGETDVLAVYRTPDRRVAVLIEDKIAAAFADRQAERYHERGSELVSRGHADDFRTVLVAPQSYLDGISGDDPWDCLLGIEEIRDWFASRPSIHAMWRAAALTGCLARLARSRVAGSPEALAFSQSLGAHLRGLHESGFDHKPTSDASAFTIRSDLTAPAYVNLTWYNGKGRVNLAFERQHLGKAVAIPPPPGVSRRLADGVSLKSDLFACDVPVADIAAGFESQLDVVAEVLNAVRRLLPIVPRVLAQSTDPGTT